ncbi:MAG: AAA family ATPase, partial [bacterium]|nr:AAA family ATPase [bacterium]
MPARKRVRGTRPKMYESFFALREPAFSLAPDPRFLLPSDTHDEGLAALIYGITRRKGFILLTGEVGTGKTTLLRAALDRIPEDTEVALVLNTAGLRPVDLLKLIATEFRLPGPFDGKVDYVIALNRFLMQQLEDGMNTVLIIDEAQNLDVELLEEVRLLSNLETDTEKLLQIVLTGQPELRQMLAAPSLRQLRQRVAVEHHIQPLDCDEVRRYLAHRIEVAGGNYDEVFSPGA